MNKLIMTLSNLLPLLLLLLVSSAHAAPGAVSAGDRRARGALDAAGLSYTVTDSGDFRLLMSFDEDRSHVVMVSSKTFTLREMEIREVWAVVSDYDGNIPAADANYLLERNTQFKLGAFAIRRFGAHTVAIFVSKVAATASAEALRAAIWATAETADDAEAHLSGADKY